MEGTLALTAIVLALGLVLAACGSDDDDPAVQGSADTTAPMDDGMMDNGDDGHMGGGHDESSDVAADARRIEVTATSFKFDPAEIRVEAGEDVAIVRLAAKAA